MSDQPTCEEQVDGQLQGAVEDLRALWEAYIDPDNEDNEVEDLGSIYDYGLSFDYVEGNTDYNPDAGYFRYQLSWGGPADEFRFYVDPDLTCYRIEYWFLNWFDGAGRTLGGTDRELLLEYYEWFKDMGVIETELEKAREL